MPKLSPEQLNSRLRLDWNIMQQINSPLVTIQAFRNMSDLMGRNRPVLDAVEAHKAVAYLVEYHIKSLIGPDRFHDRFDVSMDLLAGGDYPYTAPACFVISRPVPWSPHFFPSNGAICLGELWTAAGGNILLAHLLVHVAKLLNFDEPDREPSYGGWNAEAVQYWRKKMNRQPVTPGLAYPVIPPEFTHGLTADSKPLFRPVSGTPLFAPSPTLFRPVKG
jgi:hypothetical protein